MQAVRRMVAGRREGAADGAAGQAAAWAAALQRALAAEVGIDLVAGSARTGTARAAELVEALPERALLCRLEDGSGRAGILSLAPDLYAVLLERLTLGRIAAEAPPARLPTRTDAAMVAGAVDACFTGLGAVEAGAGLAGFRHAAHLAEVRGLPLVLDEGEQQVFSVDLSLPGGGRGGPAHLVVPVMAAQAAPAPEAGTAADAAFAAELADQVLAAPAMLDAVIARVSMRLGEVLQLAPGDWLRLGTAALDRVDLQGVDGLRRAGGRLGQSRGMRAVRLAEVASPAGRSASPRLPAAPPLEETLLRKTGS